MSRNTRTGAEMEAFLSAPCTNICTDTHVHITSARDPTHSSWVWDQGLRGPVLEAWDLLLAAAAGWMCGVVIQHNPTAVAGGGCHTQKQRHATSTRRAAQRCRKPEHTWSELACSLALSAEGHHRKWSLHVWKQIWIWGFWIDTLRWRHHVRK